jgi:hypothetical protein
LAPGAALPQFKRKQKTDFADEDIEVWNPDHLGMQSKSEKTIRKTVRKANQAAGGLEP